MGEPGSGKSALAKELARVTRGVVVEASVSVVYPIAAARGRFPNENALLQKFAAGTMNKAARVSRSQAMATFFRIREKYSPDFIARALHARYVKSSVQKTIIFSGLRGVENATYCRLHNDFVIYLETNQTTLIARLMTERGYNKQQALAELKNERASYRTREIKKIANLVVDTSDPDISAAARTITQAVRREFQMCKRCVNTARNPAITFDEDGYCQICSSYKKFFDKKHLREELRFLKTFKEVMVGISGGKDSTATLATIVQMGFHPLAFTFDQGYLPETTVPRAKKVAKALGVACEVINTRPYIRQSDVISYKKTIALYEEPFSLATKKKFLAAYKEGRKHYSVKCPHSPAFVRTCQLCRRMVIRAYYSEARKRGISAVVLGINEWTNLSAAQKGGAFRVSGMRALQPNKNQPPVYVFHLPFLLQRTSVQTKQLLKKLGWRAPKGEDFIESNSNSCLFARSTERMAKRLLGFHPDATRLAREVTVGFITKQQALKALGKIHPYRYTPREVLERAGIIKSK